MCPICSSGPVQEGDLLEVILEKESDVGEGESKPKVVIRKNDFVSSTKVDALIRNLRKSSEPLSIPCSDTPTGDTGRIRDQDPHFRAVVFSQFTTFLDIIQVALTRESLLYSRFDGTMNLKKRQAAIKTFKDPNGPGGRPQPMVLLISLKAGGVGLNLTNANYAFMVSSSLPSVPPAGKLVFTNRTMTFSRWIAGGTLRLKVKVSGFHRVFCSR